MSELHSSNHRHEVRGRDFLKTIAAVGLALLFLPQSEALGGEGALSQEQPNLLFVFPDQFRQQSMGFLNQDPVHYASVLCGQSEERPKSSFYLHIKTVANQDPADERRGVRTDRYTFVARNSKASGNTTKKQEPPYLLFDRIEDPFQLKNIAEENPDVVREMAEELNFWLRKTNDPWKEVASP